MKVCTLQQAPWTLALVRDARKTGGAPIAGIPAIVPGCVHTDLLAAGLIDDPYVDEMESKLAWIGESDWLYECRFEIGNELLHEECLELVCEGLDTVATLALNGVEIARTENMHVRYRFDVKDWVRAGENTLRLRFDSPVEYARRMHRETGEIVYAFPHLPPNNSIRKATCHFGWDWGPSLPSAGIWRSIHLEAGPAMRIVAVRPNVLEAHAERAVVEVVVDLTVADEKLAIEARLLAPGGDCVASASQPGGTPRLRLEVDQPQLWWPVGYGEQALYTLDVRVKNRVGATLAAWSRKTGLKTADIVSEPDAGGRSFAIHVNGRAVFARGYNWIPDDCFPSRVAPERMREPLRALFDEPNDLDRWHYLAQLSQARHMRAGVDYYRSLQPHCMGAIVWQLNDCWPVHSWAAVDGNGIPKLLWYALRDAFKPRHLSVRRETGETPFVFAANDTDEPWSGTLAISRRTMDGEVLAETEIPFELAPREARRLTCCPASAASSPSPRPPN